MTSIEEQIATVQEELSNCRTDLAAWGDDEEGAATILVPLIEKWSAVLATLQQHKHAMAVVEAARGYRLAVLDSYRFQDSSIDGFPEAHRKKREAGMSLSAALAALDTANTGEGGR